MAGPVGIGTGEALDASLATLISAFNLTGDEIPMLRSLATQHTLAEHAGSSYNIDLYGRLIMRSVGPGVDIAEAQDLADTQTSYSPSEIGGKVVIPRTTLRRSADPSLQENVGRMLRQAYQTKEDQDGTNQFSSFTQAFGSAGTVAGVGHIGAMVMRLRVGGSVQTPEPQSGFPIMGCFNPCSLHYVVGRMMPLSDVPTGTNVYAVGAAGQTLGPGASDMTQDLITQGIEFITKIAGARIYASANVLADASDDAINAVWAKPGLRFIGEFEAALDLENDKSARSIELVESGSYAWGLWRPSITGAKGTFAADLPTS